MFSELPAHYCTTEIQDSLGLIRQEPCQLDPSSAEFHPINSNAVVEELVITVVLSPQFICKLAIHKSTGCSRHRHTYIRLF